MSSTMMIIQRLGDGARLLPVSPATVKPTPEPRKRPVDTLAIPGSATPGAMTTGHVNAYAIDGAVVSRRWGFAVAEGECAIARPVPSGVLRRRPPG